MAGSVNKVILIGNLGTDPETKRLENGTVLSRINIATSETYTDKTGDKKEITEWHRIVLWRGLGEIAEKYLRKGQKVYIEGKLKTRSWEDESKNMRYTTEVVADEMQMLTRAEPPQQSSGGYGQPTNQKPNVQQNETTSSSNDVNLTDDEEDDLPF